MRRTEPGLPLPLFAVLLAVLLLGGCGKPDKDDAPLLGTLEWDRIGVPAEASEPILRIAVHEGQTVKQGDLLLVLDDRRMQARLAQSEAAVAQAQSRVAELIHGSRIEQLDASRAAWDAAGCPGRDQLQFQNRTSLGVRPGRSGRHAGGRDCADRRPQQESL